MSQKSYLSQKSCMSHQRHLAGHLRRRIPESKTLYPAADESGNFQGSGRPHAKAKGYLEGCGGSLTEQEIRLMPMGAKLMTLECGMRFLTDYLEGDTYFKTHREKQNLDRARTQFHLVADMERNWYF